MGVPTPVLTQSRNPAAVGFRYSNRFEVVVEHLYHFTGLRQNFAILYYCHAVLFGQGRVRE